MGKLYNDTYVTKHSTKVSQHYATDIALKTITTGSVYDVDVIKQSITNIVLTIMGERLFNIQFGTNLYALIFNTQNNPSGHYAVRSHIIDKILTYEKRISIYDDKSAVTLAPDTNELYIRINFTVNDTAESAVWENTIVL